MSRVIPFLLFLLSFSINAFAQDVTPEAAKQKAAEFLMTRQNDGNGRRAIRSRVDITDLQVKNASGSIYAVNAGDDAFVLVAKTAAIDGILGYCDNGAFDADDMPDNFRAMLSDMEYEVATLASLDNPELAKAPKKVTMKAISPIIKSKWNQGEVSTTGNVYNCQCPLYTYSNGVSYHCYTGCVATAMAQLMYFYKYPTTTKKTIPGYTSNSSIGYLSSLEVTTFDWGNMQNEYLGTDLTDVNSYRAKPISKLMKYCGYAAEMNYGTGSSLSSIQKMLSAMIDYFGYNPNAYVADRDHYTMDEWNWLIYGELTAHRPVLYAGSSSSSGHQFIIDGVDNSNRFHVNWGWGGRYDGFYLINLLNPHTTTSAGSSKTPDGYTIDHMAAIGVQPTKTDVLTGPTTISVQSSGGKVSFKFYNWTKATTSYYVGIGAINASGVIKTLMESTSPVTFEPNHGYGDYSITNSMIAANLADGTYKVCVVYSKDGKTWYPTAGSGVYFAQVAVSGYSVQNCIVHPGDCNLSAFSAKLTGNGYVNIPQEVEVSIINNRDDEGFNGVISMFVNGSQTTNAGLYLMNTSFDKAYFYFTPTQTGTYTLEFYVVDPYTNAILSSVKGVRKITITQGPNGQVEATLLSPEAKTMGGKNYVFDTVTTLEIDVYNNTPNTANGYLMLKRDDQNTMTYWTTSISPYVHKLLINHLNDLTKGKTYTYSVYYNENDLSTSGARKLCSYTFTVATGKTGDVNEDGQVDISDIVAIISQISGKATFVNADVNKDGSVDISDIVAVINLIAGQ